MDYGLIGAGTVSRYFAGRLPRLREQLGPVAATSHRLASRIVNTLRAGTPVRSIDGLESCRLILICAPGGGLPAVLPALRAATLNWAKRTLVLCDSQGYSEELADLRDLGAATASLNAIDGVEQRYVVEGDRDGIREARLLVREVNGQVLLIDESKTAAYRAALSLSGSLTVPLIESCAMALREAGVQGAEAAKLAESLFRHTLRGYAYSGRKSWSGPVAQRDHTQMDREIDALQRRHPDIAELYRVSARASMRLFSPAPRKPIPGKA